ncbi:MAG: UvrD-helicase domain-containing protein [Opitutales bacterium]
MIEASPPSKSKAIDLATFELRPGTTLIEASAGTGKTYTIQYIVLDLLLKGLDLKEILVVTFTEAATRELCDRLQGFLANVYSVLQGESTADAALQAVLDRAREQRDSDEVHRLVRRALLHADEAPIFTIHGFCQRALQENPFAADAAFVSEVCTDTTMLIEGLVRDFLCAVNLSATVTLPQAARLETLCARAKLLTGLLRVQQPFEGELSDVFGKFKNRMADLQAYESQLDAIEKEILSFNGKLKGGIYKDVFFTGLRSLLQQLFADPVAFAKSPADQKNFENLCACKIEKSFLKAHNATVIESGFFKACETFRDAHASIETEFLRYFDTWFIREFNRLKSEQGRITYDDMILQLDRALQRHERLKEQLQQRYRAALVDEFQDTDARQYSIFRTLFAGDAQAENGPYFAMIGDPKQSIYSFRGADIHAYLEARADAYRHYTLTVNYRSEAGTVEGVNAFFAGANLGEAGDASRENAIPFERVKAADLENKPRLKFAGGRQPDRLYERAVTPPEEGNHRDALEASIGQMPADVAEFLKWSGEGRILIEEYTGGAAKRRIIKPGDIAVLVNTHNEAATLQELFRSAGLLAVRGKSGDVFETAEAAHFLQFLRTCLNPDERRLNLLLVSPLFGKTDSLMKAFGDSERQKTYELFSVLGRSWKEGASVSSIWLKFLNEIGARARLLRRSDGERLLTNYLHICEMTQEIERSASLSPERLTDRILERVKDRDAGMDTETEANLIRLESDEQAIKILTMHASKGLEFPIVFLPSLWQKGIRAKAKQQKFVHTDPADPDSLVMLAEDKDRVVREQRAETLRIGYVAMTRAVHLCVYYHVPGMVTPSGPGAGNSNHKEGWFDHWMREERGEPSPNTIEAESFLPGLSGAEPMKLPEPEKPAAIQPRRLDHEISNSYQITSYSALSRDIATGPVIAGDPSVRGGGEEVHAVSDQGPPPEGDPPQEGQHPPQEDGTLLLDCFPGGLRAGTCIHEVLERCDFSDESGWERHVRAVVPRHFPEGGNDLLNLRISAVQELLARVTATPWPIGYAGSDTVDLSTVAKNQCLHEMEFYFPVHKVDAGAMETIIEEWAARNGREYIPATAGRREIDGYLTGSIDLLFVQGERYYVLDWKTNSPIPGQARSLSAYKPEGMHALMCHGRYYLQALIYSVAASAFLRDRMGGSFDWETHMGGFIYCFVRGLGPGAGWLHRSFLENEVAAAAEALGQRATRGPLNKEAISS